MPSGNNANALTISGSLGPSGSGTVTANALVAGTYGNALTLNNASNSITGTHSGSGAALTSLNFANISGTNAGSLLVGTGGTLATSGTGSITATALAGGTYGNNLTFSSASNSFTGSGAGLTSLNFANISGTNAGSLLVGTGGTLTTSGSGTITANALAAGTYGNALTLNNASNAFTGNGAGVTNIDAANIATNTVATARLGSGSASATTFLRGDQTWSSPFPGSGTLTISGVAQVNAGKCTDFTFTGATGLQTTDYLILKNPSLAGYSVTLVNVLTATTASLRVCQGNANATPTGLTINYLIARP